MAQLAPGQVADLGHDPRLEEHRPRRRRAPEPKTSSSATPTRTWPTPPAAATSISPAGSAGPPPPPGPPSARPHRAARHGVRAAYDNANHNGGQLLRPCLALLDEAGNVAAPKHLPAWVTTGRSHGISLVTVWQDLAQIRSIYGDLGSAILNNHKAKIFCSGISDPTTLDLASRLVGDRPVKELNQSKGQGGGRSWSEHTTYRRAASGDSIRCLHSDDSLLVYGNLPPARLALRPYYREGLEAA